MHTLQYVNVGVYTKKTIFEIEHLSAFNIDSLKKNFFCSLSKNGVFSYTHNTYTDTHTPHREREGERDECVSRLQWITHSDAWMDEVTFIWRMMLNEDRERDADSPGDKVNRGS